MDARDTAGMGEQAGLAGMLAEHGEYEEAETLYREVLRRYDDLGIQRGWGSFREHILSQIHEIEALISAN